MAPCWFQGLLLALGSWLPTPSGLPPPKGCDLPSDEVSGASSHPPKAPAALLLCWGLRRESAAGREGCCEPIVLACDGGSETPAPPFHLTGAGGGERVGINQAHVGRYPELEA